MDSSTIPTCPWCRCDIKGTESVVIEPYKPESSAKATSTGQDAKLVYFYCWCISASLFCMCTLSMCVRVIVSFAGIVIATAPAAMKIGDQAPEERASGF